MHIQSAFAYIDVSRMTAKTPTNPTNHATINELSGSASDHTAISQTARDLYADDVARANSTSITNATPAKVKSQRLSAALPPLLLPDRQNVAALSEQIVEKLQGFMQQNDIPALPSSITFDKEGKLELPADYAYKAQFNQALAANPDIGIELHKVTALTSHMIEVEQRMPFYEEYSAATSKAAVDAVVAKYSYLFSDNPHSPTIALNFSANGELTLTADGKTI
jgi:hypothetical protein